MKISFDLDGTYLEHPDTFDALAVMLQMAGHEVGILTNRPEEEPVEVGFDPDFEFYLGQDPELPDTIRNMAKAEKMLEEGIDMHYDDEASSFPDYVTVIEIE